MTVKREPANPRSGSENAEYVSFVDNHGDAT